MTEEEYQRKAEHIADSIVNLNCNLIALNAKLQSMIQEIGEAAIDGNLDRCDTIRDQVHDLIDLILDTRTSGILNIRKLQKEIKDGEA